MFCVKCGKQLSDNSLFCDNCGAKVGEASTPPTPVTPPTPTAPYAGAAPTAPYVQGAQMGFAEPVKPKKEKSPVIPIVICATVLAIAAIAAVVIIKFGNKKEPWINAADGNVTLDDKGNNKPVYENPTNPTPTQPAPTVPEETDAPAKPPVTESFTVNGRELSDTENVYSIIESDGESAAVVALMGKNDDMVFIVLVGAVGGLRADSTYRQNQFGEDIFVEVDAYDIVNDVEITAESDDDNLGGVVIKVGDYKPGSDMEISVEGIVEDDGLSYTFFISGNAKAVDGDRIENVVSEFIEDWE